MTTPNSKDRFEILRAFVVDWARLQKLHHATALLKLIHSPDWRTQLVPPNHRPLAGFSG